MSTRGKERAGIPLEDIPEQWRYLHEFVPSLEYWKIHSLYSEPTNIVGHIQRAFCIYWAVIMHKKTNGIGLDIGVGQIDAKTYWSLGVDHYSGDNHPAYGGAYHPDIVASGESLPIEDDTFDWVVSNHSIEHMDAKKAFNEWLRVLKPCGIIALVTPDRTYGPIQDLEKHVREYSPTEFYEEILLPLIEEKEIAVLEIDTFANHFSWNLVVEKRKK